MEAIMKPTERFKSDPEYAQIVNMLEMLLIDARIAPSDLRDCAVLACIRYAMHHTEPMAYNKRIRDALDALETD
jgi:hypothetical protein